MSDDKPLNVTVPAYQREIYDDEADQLGFDSRAAYIRSMINAGRRDFGLNPKGSTQDSASLDALIEARITTLLQDADGLTKDEVVAELEAEIEAVATDVLDRLDDDGTIDYDVQQNGFVMND